MTAADVVTHAGPHLDEAGHCLCACGVCVGAWEPTQDGGARRRCVCPGCAGGDCPNWRLDRGLFEAVGGDERAAKPAEPSRVEGAAMLVPHRRRPR